LILLQFAIPSHWLLPRRYALDYMIATDRAAPEEGALYLDIDYP
jgi:hypothetical protein